MALLVTGLPAPGMTLRNGWALPASQRWGPSAAPPRGRVSLRRSVAEKSRKAPPIPAAMAAAAVVKVGRTRREQKKNEEDAARWPDEESMMEFLNLEDKEVHSLWVRAVRHSGRQGWWKALLKAIQIQVRKSSCYSISVVATAVRECLKTYTKVSAKKKDQALELVGTLWRDLPVDDAKDEDLLYALSSSVKLCVELKTERALGWAEQLWDWSEDEELTKNDLTYGNYLQLQEVQGHFDTVNDVLTRVFVEKGIEANNMMLGNLLDLAAERRDWKRAEDLWHLMVDSLHVKPQPVVWEIMAKVYFMSGRLTQAEETLQDQATKPGRTGRRASDYLQILLILCHATPSKSLLLKLQVFLQSKQGMNRTSEVQEEWKQMLALAERLADGSDPPSFKELLVTRNAKRSAMSKWKDHEYGSMYID